MRRSFLLLAMAIAASTAAPAFSQGASRIEENGPLVVYRQVMPDGRVVYSDKAIKGIRLDHVITVAPPIKGNLWSTEVLNGPPLPPQTERTPVNRVNAIPPPGRKKTLEEATSDVIRAEMLLEDAKERQTAGLQQLKDGPGTTDRESHAMRQKWLARDVAEADAALQRALLEREAVRSER